MFISPISGNHYFNFYCWKIIRFNTKCLCKNENDTKKTTSKNFGSTFDFFFFETLILCFLCYNFKSLKSSHFYYTFLINIEKEGYFRLGRSIIFYFFFCWENNTTLTLSLTNLQELFTWEKFCVYNLKFCGY